MIGYLHMVIDSLVPLENAREAMGKKESVRQFGEIVLKVYK